VEADVHLHEHVHLTPRPAHHVGPPSRDIEIVDDEGQVGAIEEGEDAAGVHRVDRIREPDVAEARLGEDFRFARFRAADARRTARDLQPGEVHALVGLGVRPETHAPGRGRVLHAIDVAFESLLIDEDAGGPEAGNFHSGSVREIQRWQG
jgi:hypothetical protein